MAPHLKEYAEQQHGKLQDANTATRQKILDGQTTLTEARAKRDELTAKYAEQEQSIRKTRSAMVSALMPSDVEDLAAQLRTHMAELAGTRSGLLDAQKALYTAENDLQRARAEHDRISKRLAAMGEMVRREEERAKRHKAWNEKLAAPPLADLPEEAKKAMETPPANKLYTDAEDRIKLDEADEDDKGDIPAGIYRNAKSRAEQVLADLKTAKKNAEDAKERVTEHRSANEGHAGIVADCWVKFLHAEADLRDHVLHAHDRYTTALALLKGIVDSLELTQAEKDRIKASPTPEAKRASIPEHIWENLVAFVRAKAILTKLSVTKPGKPEAETPGDEGEPEVETPGEEGGAEPETPGEEGEPDAETPSEEGEPGAETPGEEGEPTSLLKAMTAAEEKLVEALRAENESNDGRVDLEEDAKKADENLEFSESTLQLSALIAARHDS